MKIRKWGSFVMAGILAASALTVHAKDSEYLGRGTVGDKWYASSVYGASPAVEDQPEGGSAYVECRHVDKAGKCIL